MATTPLPEQTLRCARCRALMERTGDTAENEAAVLEFYACVGCGRKLVLWWELTGAGVTPEQRGWVEDEVARRGSFFPADWTGSRR